MTHPPFHTHRLLHEPDLLVVRSALLPFSALRLLGARESEGDGSPLQHCRQRLIRVLDDGVLRELLRRADAAAMDEFETWARNSPGEVDLGARPALEARLFLALSRLAAQPGHDSRCDGSTRGNAGRVTFCHLAARADWRRLPRLAAGHARELARRLQALPAIAVHTRWYPNDTLTLIGQEYRYLERLPAGDDGIDRLRESSTEADDVLEWLIETCRDGKTLGALEDALCAHIPAVPPGVLKSHLRELRERQVLVSDALPPLTTQDLLAHLEATLRRAGVPGERTVLGSYRQLMQRLAEPLSVDVGPARDVFKALGVAASEAAGALPIDLIKPGLLSVRDDLLAELCDTVGAIAACTARPPTALERFKAEFIARFGRAEVPLAQALDECYGVGRALRELPDGAPGPGTQAGSASPWDLLVLRAVVAAQVTGADRVQLDRAEVDRLAAASATRWPERATMGVRLLDVERRDSTAVAQLLRLTTLQARSVFTPLARSDAAVTAWLRADGRRPTGHAGSADSPLGVELVFAPGDAAADALTRPALADGEIHVLSTPGAEAAGRITLDDLLVSVVDDSVRLYSHRLGREVRPRLWATMPPHDGEWPAAIRLLAAVEHDGSAILGDRPLVALPGLRHVPRILLDRVLLQPARWMLTIAEVRELQSLADPIDRLNRMARLRESLGIPRWISGSGALAGVPFDLGNPIALSALVQHMAPDEEAELFECVEHAFDNPVTGPEGSYAHELLVPMRTAQRAPLAAGLEAQGLAVLATAKRRKPLPLRAAAPR